MFFCHPELEDLVRVLHTTGPGRLRPSPASVPVRGGPDDPAALLAEVAGVRVPAPRWPVRVRPATPGDLASRGVRPPANTLRTAFQTGTDLRLPDYAPFDWPTAQGFLRTMHETTDHVAGLWVRKLSRDDAERAAQVARLTARRDYLARAAAEVTAMAGRGPFDAAARARVIALALGAAYPAYAVGPRDPAAEQSGISYAVLLETWARHLRSTRPGVLPAALQARLEPLWTADARRERAYLGGTVHEGFPHDRMEDAVFLMELPSSTLTGRMFGDMSNWGVFLPPAALEAGDFGQAWGSVLN